MNEFEYKEFSKRYDKFKNNNLPTPFFDKERQTLEYVYFDNDEDNKKTTLQVNSDLIKALGDIARTGLYYSFSTKNIDSKNSNRQCHAHSFEEVVRALYDFPESFHIAEDEEEFYSKQELDYLKQVQKYLLNIGLKDLESEERHFNRYQNKNRSKCNNVQF